MNKLGNQIDVNINLIRKRLNEHAACIAVRESEVLNTEPISFKDVVDRVVYNNKPNYQLASDEILRANPLRR